MATLSLRHSQIYRNPDEDFVLHGHPASYWEKPSYLSNSKLTTTSDRLSQHAYFDPSRYQDRRYAKSLGDLAFNLEKVSEDVNNTLTKSVTFLDVNDHQQRRDAERTEMYSRDTSTRYEFPRAATSELSPRFSSSKREFFSSAREFSPEEMDRYPLTTSDSTALKYFPVTMTSSVELEKLKGKLSKSQSMSASEAGRSRALARSRSALSRLQKSATDLKYERLKEPKYSSKERDDIEKMYLITSEAPVTSSAARTLTSPFEVEISKLRRERLRIEEDRLWELRKLEEIERLRPPKTKWYESSGPDFHYECHKNTELEKTNQKWKDTMKKKERNTELLYSLENACL